MRLATIVLWGALLGACGQSAPNVYPAEARARFEMSCPAENEVCVCTWDKITRVLSYEEYEAALERFRETGQMEPRVTRARTQCLEQRES